MFKLKSFARLVFVVLMVMVNGCASSAETLIPTETSPPASPTFTSSPIPPTNTATLPPPTDTSTPSPIPDTATPEPTSTSTPLPGLVVLPVDTLGTSIPWLPLDVTVRPTIQFLEFNVLRPPFNKALVRQAFAHAIDRDVIVEMATRYKTINAKPATSLTPPQTLGRDLYNVVGATFDPEKAKNLLAEAGYTDPSAFPTATILVNAYGDTAPGARFNMATSMAEMWKTNLGVTVKVEVVATFRDYGSRLRTNPAEIFWQGWVADINDPDNFLGEIFRSDAEFNFGKFANPEFDRLIDKAAASKEPEIRQDLYIQAERILCESEAALIPLYHSTVNIP